MPGKVIFLNLRNVRLQIFITISLMVCMLSFHSYSSPAADRYISAAFFLPILFVYSWGIYVLSWKTVFNEEFVLHRILPVSQQNMLLGKTAIASLWGMAIGLTAWGSKITSFWSLKSEDEFDSSGTVIYYFQLLAAKYAASGMSRWEMTLMIGLMPVFFLNLAVAIYLFLSAVASFCHASSHTQKTLAKGVVYGVSAIIICAAVYGGYVLTFENFLRILLSQLITLAVAACCYRYCANAGSFSHR